jgi:hypothetical protein
MMQFINQYLPEIATVSAIAVPVIPLLIKRKISDSNLLAKVTEVKDVADKLSQKELALTKNIQNITHTTEQMKNDVEIMKNGVTDEMAKVSDQLLGFQQGDMYQKMLLGLSQLDEMQLIIKNNEELIQSQAQTIKDIKKKLE